MNHFSMRNRPNTITVVFFAPAGCYNIKNLILTLYCAPKAQKNEDSQGEIASKLLKKRVLLGGKQFNNYNNCFELHIIIESHRILHHLILEIVQEGGKNPWISTDCMPLYSHVHCN